MTKTTPMMEVTRRYGHTVYTISAFGNPEANSTYEERLLHLIQHEAEKMDSSQESNINTTTNTDHNEGGIS